MLHFGERKGAERDFAVSVKFYLKIRIIQQKCGKMLTFASSGSGYKSSVILLLVFFCVRNILKLDRGKKIAMAF